MSEQDDRVAWQICPVLEGLTVQDGRRKVALVLASTRGGWWSVRIWVLPLFEEGLCLVEENLGGGVLVLVGSDIGLIW